MAKFVSSSAISLIYEIIQRSLPAGPYGEIVPVVLVNNGSRCPSGEATLMCGVIALNFLSLFPAAHAHIIAARRMRDSLLAKSIG